MAAFAAKYSEGSCWTCDAHFKAASDFKFRRTMTTSSLASSVDSEIADKTVLAPKQRDAAKCPLRLDIKKASLLLARSLRAVNLERSMKHAACWNPAKGLSKLGCTVRMEPGVVDYGI